MKTDTEISTREGTREPEPFTPRTPLGKKLLAIRNSIIADGLPLLTQEEIGQLRFRDIDFTKDQILVRDGKGQKDRITTLPASVKEPLLAHLRDVWRLHQRDLREGAGRVVLP